MLRPGSGRRSPRRTQPWGISVSFPLTRSATTVTGQPSSFLDIPWLLVLYVVLGVPLLAALGAACLTRSRLPLTVRTE